MDTIDKLAAQIERYIASIPFPAEPSRLYEPIIYTLDVGGKRLRPALMLMAYRLFKDEIDDSVLACATAVEFFHNFTLLHDDIMDNADVRRGKSSVQKKWGSNRAILSGDAMVICAYKQLDNVRPEIMQRVLLEFNKMALEVCEGQQYDMDFEHRENVTLEEYTNMIRLKTAVIFAAGAKIGAIAAGASKEDSEVLYNFGLQLGLSFQIQDDYLDTYGTAEVLGKQVGGDIEESKKTFLTITALNEAGGATNRAMLATLRDNTIPADQKLGRMRTIYNSLDIPKITRNIISDHLKNASDELDKLSVKSDNITALRATIEQLKNRNK